MATTTESTDSNPTSARAEDFGPNEWLIEEMYARFQADQASVDPAWHEFFADYTPSNPAGASEAAAEPAAAAASAPAAAGAPAATAATAAPAVPSPAVPAAAAPTTAAPTTAAPTAAAPATAAPTTAVPTSSVADLVAADPASTQLRGAAARVVANMESSLAIPTATSVRAVPAKALIDNRTVINSALRRSRGGLASLLACF